MSTGDVSVVNGFECKRLGDGYYQIRAVDQHGNQLNVAEGLQFTSVPVNCLAESVGSSVTQLVVNSMFFSSDMFASFAIGK